MDGATLQSRIYRGYAAAAQRIGQQYAQYRPSGAGDPLATSIATLYVSLNAEDMAYGRPNKYGKPTWYALLDGTQTQPGDYLQGPGGTFFIAAQQQALPVLVVECNTRVYLARMAAPTGGGVVGYGGNIESQAVNVLGSPGAGWPASVLLGGRSDKIVSTAMSVKSSGWQILIPPSVPVTIAQGDVLHDDLGRRYAVYAAELTDLGWRINANEEHA